MAGIWALNSAPLAVITPTVPIKMTRIVITNDRLPININQDPPITAAIATPQLIPKSKPQQTPAQKLAKVSAAKVSATTLIQNKLSSLHSVSALPSIEKEVSINLPASSSVSVDTNLVDLSRKDLSKREENSPVTYHNNPTPIYPLVARRRGLEGTVILSVMVDTAGVPAMIDIKQSSGSLILDDAARVTIHNWRFEPARRAGIKSIATVDIPIRFQLLDR